MFMVSLVVATVLLVVGAWFQWYPLGEKASRATRAVWFLLSVVLILVGSFAAWRLDTDREIADQRRDIATRELTLRAQPEGFFDSLEDDSRGLFPLQNPRLFPYLMYAYEWGGYRGSENNPWSPGGRLINPPEPITRPTFDASWRLDLGIYNGMTEAARNVVLTLRIPPDATVTSRADEAWQRHDWHLLPGSEYQRTFVSRFMDIPPQKGFHASQPLYLRFLKNGEYELSYTITSDGVPEVSNAIRVYVGPS